VLNYDGIRLYFSDYNSAGYSIGSSPTGVEKHELVNCNFYDSLRAQFTYVGPDVYNNEAHDPNTYSYASSGLSVSNCKFYRGGCTSPVLAYQMGPESTFIDNEVINATYMVFSEVRSIGFFNTYPEIDSFVMSGNTLRNCYVYTGLCSMNFHDNDIQYTHTLDRSDAFKPGAKNGITIHVDKYHKSIEYKIIDNTILNVPEDAVLIEGYGPYEYSQRESGYVPEYTVVPGTGNQGQVTNITISGNILSNQNTSLKGLYRITDPKKYKGDWASNIWLSDCANVHVYENIILGSRNEDGYDRGVDE